MPVIEVAGRACRLPGANSVSDFWRLLTARRCSVTRVPEERFAQSWYFNPRRGEPGKAYTFAAGVIDDIWGFDPGIFAITPREARQMDPQQRLVLQLVWEALEDAGVPASSLARRNIGVYMGASSMDHSHRQYFDPAGTDSYLMTGNTLSLIANRISYQFDLTGPSLTIDTACSSSLVALDYAMQDLRAGKIDAAIVGGVNGLLSPFNFMGFCAASMLSPDGLCRAFDHRANGYVRAEGGVVMILQRADAAFARHRVHGQILASAMNADGRTSGVALPSMDQQAELLRTLYADAGIDPKKLAFVEAHGTGTLVGDPVECHALGKVLGAARRTGLPIGSAKSNVGHLEPASGLVGLLKAQLALEHGVLPPTLHVEALNPHIPFDDLNLQVAVEPVPLDHLPLSRRLAGINNFGFGGTNVHVIIGPAKPARSTSRTAAGKKGRARSAAADHGDPLLLLSAQCQPGLMALARKYAEHLEVGAPASSLPALANAIAHQRDLMPERLAVVGGDPDVVTRALRGFADGETPAQLMAGSALGRSAKTAFVFSGNGAQWAGMGRCAVARSPAFRHHFMEVDEVYRKVAGVSLAALIEAEDLEQQIDRTEIAQPLLFAIQIALAKCFMARGITPAVVIGHSVGEVAAAHISGALDLMQAASVIRARSHHQEIVRGLGRMAALQLSQMEAEALIAESRLAHVTVAAVNSPRSVTLAGDGEDVRLVLQMARERHVAGKLLDIQYPFHSARLEPARRPIVEALAGLKPRASTIPLHSTVSGKAIAGHALGSEYWWRNVRAPVRFLEAIQSAAAQGCQIFIEIGPRSILRTYMSDSLAGADQETRVLATLEPADEQRDVDPVAAAIARGVVAGAAFDRDTLFGPPSVASVPLPHYPWQNKEFRMAPSAEAMGSFSTSHIQHPLLGARLRSEDIEWDRQLDTAVLPYLEDHKIGDRVIMPGAAYVEMALAAAIHQLKSESVELRDIDFIQALELSADHAQEMRTRVEPESATITIASRARLGLDARQIHMRTRFALMPSAERPQLQAPMRQTARTAPPCEDMYRLARRFHLNYGPSFRRMSACREVGADIVEVELVTASAADAPHVGRGEEDYFLHPVDFDACLHGLNVIYARLSFGENKLSFVPVRIGSLRVFQPGVRVSLARIRLGRYSTRGAVAGFELFADDGTLVALVKDMRFKAASLVHRLKLGQAAYHVSTSLQALPEDATLGNVPTLEGLRDTALSDLTVLDPRERASLHENGLLIELAARRVLYDAARAHADAEGKLPPAGPGVPLAGQMLPLIVQTGLAQEHDGSWQLEAQNALPPLEEITASIMADDPRWSAECTMLLNAAENLAPALAREAQPSPSAASWHSAATLEHFHASAPLARAQMKTLRAIIRSAVALASSERPCRMLQIGANAGLLRALAPLLQSRHVHLVVADADPKQLSRLASQWQGVPRLEFVPIDDAFAELGTHGPFDLVASLNALSWMSAEWRTLAALGSVLADRALVLLAEREPDLFHRLTLATGPDERPLNLRDRSAWQEVLQATGYDVLDDMPEPLAIPGASLLIAAWRTSVPESVEVVAAVAQNPAVILVGREAKSKTGFGQALSDVLAAQGLPAVLCSPGLQKAAGKARQSATGKKASGSATAARAPVQDWGFLVESFDGASPAPSEIVFALDAEPVRAREHMGALMARLEALTSLLQTLSDRTVRLWIIAEGGARALAGLGAACPVQTGVWSFMRTAMNEYAKIDVRLVDFAEGVPVAQKAARFAQLLRAPAKARELVLSAQGMAVLEVHRGAPGDVPRAPAAVADVAQAIALRQRERGNLEELQWVRVERRAPVAHEVEIEVVSSGLNFRDVMWSLGILPEEALEDGFAGPSIGLECAGRVVRVGPDVADFAVGDPVIAIAPAAFASHVTVAARAVARLPGNVPLPAAASIPVAFLTACYALETLARVRKGEWVLVHGAAGGVGLAAIQVARRNGARVIATAGSDEKRNFLRRLGAEIVLDTRSLDFVDRVRELAKDGVGLVLNSLAGEAMERSLELLRPFGRFIELGKRDFYASTKVSLRPFRNNISYFGVDADQLLTYEPDVAQQVLASVVAGFESGDFSPLPCRIFSSAEVVDAFRLMQKSGHIGKIIVEAPGPGDATVERNAEFTASADGYHVIFGGTGGFGLAYARWLADRGARHILIASRSGGESADVLTLAQSLQVRGIALTRAVCDVTDRKAVANLLARLREERPIAGVSHTAMVLDDGLIRSLSAERLQKVLAPKVEGAGNLDLLTRGDPLDYFILFSSAAAMFGNPGQASYVAANGYLDGLAQQRQAAGHPALAVAWGAITDVGVLTRDKASAKSLSRHTGGLSFTAREGLDLLAHILADPQQAGIVNITLAAMNWGMAKDLLPIMNAPAYDLIRRDVAARGEGAVAGSDLREMVRTLDEAGARGVIADYLRKEVASIFRMPPEDINPKRSLTDIGMDSLMGLELRMAVERQIGIDIMKVSMTSGTTIHDIADHIASRLRGSREDEEAALAGETLMVSQHVTEVIDIEDLRRFESEVSAREAGLQRVI